MILFLTFLTIVICYNLKLNKNDQESDSKKYNKNHPIFGRWD